MSITTYNAADSLDHYKIKRLIERIGSAVGLSRRSICALVGDSIFVEPTWETFSAVASVAGLQWTEGPVKGSVTFTVTGMHPYGAFNTVTEATYIVRFPDKPDTASARVFDMSAAAPQRSDETYEPATALAAGIGVLILGGLYAATSYRSRKASR